ncbi:hypothetical protein IAD21_00209 [Abditibacteriota bacterium]|nr:hypothetical protein IAD21_00209 [Abditibacteriota bacterium]
MTQQEVEAMAARLTRIWGGIIVPWRSGLRGHVTGTVHFEFRIPPHDKTKYIVINRFENGFWDVSHTGSLRCDFERGAIEIGPDREAVVRPQLFQQFAAEWMSFFRRGCWLSGCPIDATAHEKMEWIQGFTREELEAWKLEF